MKEHGIIMSAPMVLALLAGRKTVTRRAPKGDRWAKVSPGDRLWVRETWSWRDVDDGDEIRVDYVADGGRRYFRGIGEKDAVSDWQIRNGRNERKTRPAIHMPRWASRILLEVVSVDRETGAELLAISDEEALAEGIYFDADHPWTDAGGVTHPPASGWTWDAAAQTYPTPREAYLALFREINGDEVPDHLWRIEFRRVG